jgi:PAS domain S-box-containing protein
MNYPCNPGQNPFVTTNERQNSSFAPEISKNSRPEFISTAQLYEAVYENAFHPMYIGSIDGKIIKFNEKFSKLLGFLPDEIKKLRSTDFFKTNDASYISFLEKRKEKGIAKAEVRGIKKSGETFPCRISSVCYQSDQGEKRYMNTLVNISAHISARWNIAG